MWCRLAAVALGLGLTVAVGAAEKIDSIDRLSQSRFREVSKDLGAILAYRPLSTAVQMDPAALELGASYTRAYPRFVGALEQAAGGDGFGTFDLAGAHFRKGLPYGIALGGSYAAVARSNLIVTGFELSYSPLPSTARGTQFAIRTNYTTVGSVDQLDLHTRGLEFVVSQRQPYGTPLLGAGLIWVDSDVRNVAGLEREVLRLERYFGGLRIDTRWAALTLGVDHTGGSTSASAQLAYPLTF